ncbi:hypothetical protein L2K20_27450 [Mycobacterium sp. MBM]|nr:hypothetical protein [Mycobacterium sp. MBM]
MSRELILIHGRSQQGKDPAALKREWLDALADGLSKSGLTLPVAEKDVRFVFYGDTLNDFSLGKSADEVADVVTRGAVDESERGFMRKLLEEVCDSRGISQQDLDAALGHPVGARGPQNWPWVVAVLKVIEKRFPNLGAPLMETFTHDVYLYLTNEVCRERIDDAVADVVAGSGESVVVSHSLGTVVAYHVLLNHAGSAGWEVPLFVTLGSPLAMSVVSSYLRSHNADNAQRAPGCTAEWFNAYDPQDIVALHPLDTAHFPLEPTQPAITNKGDVVNSTGNQHGISGYLSDPDVAARIHHGLKGD